MPLPIYLMLFLIPFAIIRSEQMLHLTASRPGMENMLKQFGHKPGKWHRLQCH